MCKNICVSPPFHMTLDDARDKSVNFMYCIKVGKIESSNSTFESAMWKNHCLVEERSILFSRWRWTLLISYFKETTCQQKSIC